MEMVLWVFVSEFEVEGVDLFFSSSSSSSVTTTKHASSSFLFLLLLSLLFSSPTISPCAARQTPSGPGTQTAPRRRGRCARACPRACGAPRRRRGGRWLSSGCPRRAARRRRTLRNGARGSRAPPWRPRWGPRRWSGPVFGGRGSLRKRYRDEGGLEF